MDRETLKIKKVQSILQTNLSGDAETASMSFEVFLKEPEFKDVQAIKSTLNLIQARTAGRVSWEPIMKERLLHAPDSVAITSYVPPVPLPSVEVGATIHVTDPAKLARYFEEALNAPRNSGHRLIEKNERGDYLYNGKLIEIEKATLHCDILDILLSHCEPDGFISYENIEKYLVDEKRQEPIVDEMASKKRILNATTNKQQGLFKRARVGNEVLPNKTLGGAAILGPARKRKGLMFNNPILP